MACKDKDSMNDEVKKQLRSLIISTPKGVTVRQLQYDYGEMVGGHIPYSNMGYMSLEQYLLSIPDTCRLNGTGPHALVIPVVTEKNKHLNDMVMHQRAPKANPRNRCRKRSRGVYNHNPAPPPRPLIPTFHFPENPEARKIVLPPPPEYIRDQRRAQNRPKNTNFCDSKFNNSYSYNNPGYSSSGATKSHYNIDPKFNNNYSYNNPVSSSSGNKSDYMDPKFNNSYNNPVPSSSRVTKSDYTGYNYPLPSSSGTKSDYMDPKFNSYNNPPSSSGAPKSDYTVPPTYNDNPQKISKPFYTDDENVDSESDPEYLLPDFSDDDDFCYQSEDEKELTSAVNNLSVRSNIEENSEFPPAEDEAHVSSISKKVSEKLQILINEHPEGIWCSKLLKMYQERFNHKLDPLNFGFTSVIQMCDDLPDVFQCTRPNRTDWKVYDAKKPIPETTLQDFSVYLNSLPRAVPESRTTDEPALPTNITFAHDSNYEYPEEVIRPGEIIPRQWLVNYEKVGDYIELIVAEVFDPSKFWIQLKGPTTSDKLHKLMDDMQVYYMQNATNWQLNESNIRVGLMCSALFMNEYHRAVIVKIFEDQTIKVFYFDYGTVCTIPIKRAFLLVREFIYLPMQAVRARLANIIPKEQNTMWTMQASKTMLRLVAEKNLIGYINDIDTEQEILDLIITDTTSPDVDIHINDALIEKGFAVLGVEAPLCTTSSALISNVHLYPAFEELENAIYPSLGEVDTMLKIGHQYETIFHGYFYPANENVIDLSSPNNSGPVSSVSLSCSRSVSVENEETESQQCSEVVSENISVQDELVEICPEKTEDTKEKSLETDLDESKNSCDSKQDSTEPEVIRTRNPPPGFENVQPQNFNIPLMQQQTTSAIVYPSFPNPLNPYPNPLLQTNNLLLLANPLFYNQFLHQLKHYNHLQQAQQYANLQAFNNLASNIYSNFAPPQNNFYSKPNNPPGMSAIDSTKETSLNLKTEQTQTDDLNPNSKTANNPTVNTDSISNKSEHFCERFIIQLKIENYFLHILRIDDELYVISQEIITNLLKSDLPWKRWLISVNINENSFPNKLINIMENTHVYNQLKKFPIPGLNAPNNLGCNLRITPLNQVSDLVEKYGNRNLLTDLKAGIKHVMENPNIWKSLEASSD